MAPAAPVAVAILVIQQTDVLGTLSVPIMFAFRRQEHVLQMLMGLPILSIQHPIIVLQTPQVEEAALLMAVRVVRFAASPTRAFLAICQTDERAAKTISALAVTVAPTIFAEGAVIAALVMTALRAPGQTQAAVSHPAPISACVPME